MNEKNMKKTKKEMKKQRRYFPAAAFKNLQIENTLCRVILHQLNSLPFSNMYG